MFLERMTTFEVKEAIEKGAVFVLPLGSVEQHGSHLALGTDYVIPQYLGEKLSNIENVIILPTMPYGYCPYHLGFAGSIDIGHDGLYTVMTGIYKSLIRHGAKKFAVLNGHGGNNATIDRAGLFAYQNGAMAATLDWWILAGQIDPRYDGGHADKIETSAMMAIDTKYADLSKIKELKPANLSDKLTVSHINVYKFKNGKIKIMRDTEATVPNGWINYPDKEPGKSSAEFGKEFLEAVAAYLTEFLEEYKKI